MIVLPAAMQPTGFVARIRVQILENAPINLLATALRQPGKENQTLTIRRGILILERRDAKPYLAVDHLSIILQVVDKLL